MNTILLAYDDTESGETALRRAAELTTLLDARLIVTTVAPTLINTVRGGGRIDPVDSPARRHDLLAGVRADLTARGVEAKYLLLTGTPADMIVHAAKECGADLIVIGRRSTNLVKRLLGQSVSESVLNKARCTVLLAQVSEVPAKAITDTTDERRSTTSRHASDSLPEHRPR
jgi:nucleotide-binding universal stress UspA family protein